MTERFTVDDGLEDVLCWEINDRENENMTCGECVKLLNELHEENEQLKNDCGILVQSNQDYRKENKQLKFELKECREHKLFSRRQLEEENEQLKQFIKELTTKGTGKIDLANGYSYNVSAVLTDYRGDVE